MTETRTLIDSQLDTYGIEFGKRYKDPHSDFEGVATAMFFYQHGCLRVNLRGTDRQSGSPAEYTFDAPELVAVETGQPVPVGERTGGPHGLTAPPRR